MSEKTSMQRTDAMSQKEIKNVRKTVKITGYTHVFIGFICLMIVGLVLLIIGIIYPQTHITVAGGIFTILSGILAFIIGRLGKNLQKDMAGSEKITGFSIITGKRIDADSSLNKTVKQNILILNDLEFEVPEKTYNQFEAGETVEIQYTKSTGILISIHKR
ncbi:MAG: ABC transporter ATP-binding protein [Brevinematales bacterium]|nr:ABC transporter ATP-binding protein [Brevinematales bacterium]